MHVTFRLMHVTFRLMHVTFRLMQVTFRKTYVWSDNNVCHIMYVAELF